MDDCRNTAEAAVRRQERVLEMDQDKEDVQGSEVSGTGKEIVTLLRGEIGRAVESIKSIGPKIKGDLEEARIAPKYRLMNDRSVEQQVQNACETLETLERGMKSYLTFGKELTDSSQKRGIESLEDWHDFLKVVERDGDLLAEICNMLNTDVLQVRDVVGEIQKLQEKQAKDMMRNDEEM
uniref:Biogenesis of lysosome-related organelles complex 1 subunit 1 n=1 Tax=Haemonchus contortus TaxID=6289 RepID=A0A7I4YVL6_HAECO